MLSWRAGGGPKNAAPRRERENQLTTLTNEAPYKACSGFTRVTARRIAQPPKATFVARLRPGRLPDQAARQLPDYRQLSGWNPPPQVSRAVGAHCQERTIPERKAVGRRTGPRTKTASCAKTSNLRNFSPHAPGSRRQGEGAILAIFEQALAHARFELPTAILRERYDVSAPRACARRKRLPIIVE